MNNRGKSGSPLWSPGDQVYWRDNDTVWTVQPGPCSAGPGYVHLTAPGYSVVAWQGDLVAVPQ